MCRLRETQLAGGYLLASTLRTFRCLLDSAGKWQTEIHTDQIFGVGFFFVCSSYLLQFLTVFGLKTIINIWQRCDYASSAASQIWCPLRPWRVHRCALHYWTVLSVCIVNLSVFVQKCTTWNTSKYEWSNSSPSSVPDAWRYRTDCKVSHVLALLNGQ